MFVPEEIYPISENTLLPTFFYYKMTYVVTGLIFPTTSSFTPDTVTL